MNERIKDLLEEAGLVSYGEDTGFYNIPAPAFLSRIDRLAELIVRECLEQGSILAKHYIDTHPEQEQVMLLASIADYSSEIKKHFGVEE
jgi:hypothetical protein